MNILLHRHHHLAIVCIEFSGENGIERVTRTTNYRITYKFFQVHTQQLMCETHILLVISSVNTIVYKK